MPAPHANGNRYLVIPLNVLRPASELGEPLLTGSVTKSDDDAPELEDGGTMIAAAVRAMFGTALAAAIACFVISLLPLMTGGAVDRRLAGSDSVAVVLGQAVYPMIAVAFVACVVCWVGYARCVLRAAPKAEAEVQPA